MTILPLAGAVAVFMVGALSPRTGARLATGFWAMTAGVAALLFTAYRPVADELASLWIREGAYALLPHWNVVYQPAADGLALIFAAVLAGLGLAASLSMNGEATAIRAGLLAAAGCAFGALFSTDLFLLFAFAEAAFALGLSPVFGAARDGAATPPSAGRSLLFLHVTGYPMLLAILALHWAGHGESFDLASLMRVGLESPPATQNLMFAAFALTLAARVGIFPFHGWAIRAAETAEPSHAACLCALSGSLGVYGFARVAVPLLPVGSATLGPWVAGAAAVGIVHLGALSLTRREPGRLIAIASSAFWSLAALGIVTGSRPAISGAILLLVGQGLVFGALLIMLAALRERGDVPLAVAFANMPRLSSAFALAVLSLVGIPGTAGFVAQFLTLAGAFAEQPLFSAMALVGLAPISVAAVSLLRRAKSGDTGDTVPPRLTARESVPLTALLAAVVLLGIRPGIVLERINPSVDRLAEEVRHRRALSSLMEKPIRAVEDPFADDDAEPPDKEVTP
ncbi:MAG: proton-conducting transporter membrane subunit [Deltaproteobacteria bacterium]|nr:proton-conducting transporter membrane subunit [Deltaproteobacteria bacterium]